MFVRNVRDLHSDRSIGPLFCKVLIENDITELEYKDNNNQKRRIRWEDVLYQVEAAERDAQQKNNQII